VRRHTVSGEVNTINDETIGHVTWSVSYDEDEVPIVRVGDVRIHVRDFLDIAGDAAKFAAQDRDDD
jgi:hypothetical protein